MNFSIVVPIKNQFKIVKMCIESILRHYKDQEVILIDDGSTEEQLISYLKEIQQQNPNWIVFFSTKSSGHSAACTIGINGSKHENVFLLNSDTILTKNCLNILSEVLDNNSKIAVVGPSTSSASGPQMLPGLYNKRFQMSINDIENFATDCEVNKEIQDLELINGFCLGIKKTVFKSIGGFDVSLECYGNEKELLIRIRKAGYRTVWVKNSYCHHYGKMSYSQSGINVGQAQKDADNYILRKHSRLQ
jgi:hypothetical protein